MSSEETRPVQPEESPESTETPEADPAQEEAGGRGDELEALKKRYEELERQYIRLKADFENFRRRSRQEIGEIADVAKSELALELLPVLDNLERALDSSEDTSGSFTEGVSMVARQLREVLQRAGMEPIPAVGLPFDPHRHEAVQRVADAEAPEGTVVSEFRTGYTFKGKLLRPSMVTVSSGNDGGDQEDEQSNRN